MSSPARSLSCRLSAAHPQITLGEIAVDEKSNEIKAVPELLDLINVKGDIVTADAMSCQKEIAAKITERGADYVLALKDNQKTFKKDAEDYFLSAGQAPDFYPEAESDKTLEKDHGRIEKREYYLTTDISWLDDTKKRDGLRANYNERHEIFHYIAYEY